MIYALIAGTDHLAWPATSGFHPVQLESHAAWLAFTRFDEVAAEVQGRTLIHGAAGWRERAVEVGRNVRDEPVMCEVHHFESLAKDPRVAAYPHLWKEWSHWFAPRVSLWHGRTIAHVGAAEAGSDAAAALKPIRDTGAVPSIDSAGEVVKGGEAIQASLVGCPFWCIEAAPLADVQCKGYSYSLSDRARALELEPQIVWPFSQTGGTFAPMATQPTRTITSFTVRGGTITKLAHIEQRLYYMPGFPDPRERMGQAVEALERGFSPVLYVLPDQGKAWGEGMNLSKRQVKLLMEWK